MGIYTMKFNIDFKKDGIRFAINTWCMSEEGMEWLLELSSSGNYKINTSYYSLIYDVIPDDETMCSDP